MVRRAKSERLVVYLNARRVGLLERDAAGGIAFDYDVTWLDWESAMPVSTSLPLTGETFRGSRVTNVFENLLPDAERVRRNVAERLGARGIDAFSLLTVTGRDCVGALQFLSEDDEPGPPGSTDGEPLDEAEIAKLIRRLRVEPLGLIPENEDFRISIAGAQDKTALLRRDNTWFRPTGTTATTHIFKPAIGVIQHDLNLEDSVQNEYLCLKLCSALGLDVCETEILQFEDQLVLSVERFDRLWTREGRLLRLPQEDFCQALSIPSTLKYQRDGGPDIITILERLKESDEAIQNRYDFLKSQMIFWLLGATDGHSKNYSINLRPRGTFSLTPFYDVISAQPLVDAAQLRHNRYKLALSVGDQNHTRLDEIQVRHFQQTSEAADMPRGTISNIVGELIEAIPAAIAEAENLTDDTITEKLVASIVSGIQDRQETMMIGMGEL